MLGPKKSVKGDPITINSLHFQWDIQVVDGFNLLEKILLQ